MKRVLRRNLNVIRGVSWHSSYFPTISRMEQPNRSRKPEPSELFAGTEARTGTGRSRFPLTETGTAPLCYKCTETQRKPSLEEPPEPKTGTVRIRSRPGKPNQRKGQNEKFMNFAHFCEFWCFSLGKQARFTLNFCSGMPLREVHELAFFGLVCRGDS